MKGGDRPAKTFQLQVSEVFEPRDRFDRFSDAAADQDLPVLGFSTKPGGEAADRANGYAVATRAARLVIWGCQVEPDASLAAAARFATVGCRWSCREKFCLF